MKKFIIIINLIILIISSFLNLIYSKNIDIKCENPINIIKKFFDPDIKLKEIKIGKYEFDEKINLCTAPIYEKNKKLIVLVYTPDSKYIFLGKILDISTKEDYLELKYSNKYDNNNLNLFNYKYLIKADPYRKVKYIIFADPLCSYCRKAIIEANKHKDLANFGVIISPLSLKSLNYSYRVICSKNPIESLIKKDYSSICSKKELEKAQNMIEFSLKIKDKLNINQEPIYFFENGEYLIGYRNFKTIKKKINIK